MRTLLSKQTYGAWAAVYFLYHVLHRSDPKEGKMLQILKESVSNQALFRKPRYSNMYWYRWCDLVEKLLNGGHVDDCYSAKMKQQCYSTSVHQQIRTNKTSSNHRTFACVCNVISQAS